MIKNIVFDLNGVFVISSPLSKILAQHTGIPDSEIYEVLKKILQQVRQPDRGGDEVWQPLLDKINMSKDEFFNLYFSSETLDSEMIEVLKKVKTAGLKTYILSNNFRERTTYYRQQYPEFFALFDHAYFSWETGHVKPNLLAFTNLMDDAEILPEETLYFDDQEENIKSAKTLGFQAHLFKSKTDIQNQIDSVLSQNE